MTQLTTNELTKLIIATIGIRQDFLRDDDWESLKYWDELTEKLRQMREEAKN